MQVHPNIVRVRNIFISNEWDSMNALTFVHDFIFGAMTLRSSQVTYALRREQYTLKPQTTNLAPKPAGMT